MDGRSAAYCRGFVLFDHRSAIAYTRTNHDRPVWEGEESRAEYWVLLAAVTVLILFRALALVQSPFETGFTAIQTLFTGTVASPIAIVVGGYQFAHGEPGAKKIAAC